MTRARVASATARLSLVVFDLAGTTVKDTTQVASAFERALAEQGITIGASDLARVRGASKRGAIADLIPRGPDHARRSEAAYATFRAHLVHSYREHGVHPVDGAEEVFRALRDRSIRVALNTGFDRDITTLLLATLRWDTGVVDAVVCGDDVSAGRPAPFLIFRAMEATGVSCVHDVMNVGDTALDLYAGHNAGVRWNVGVLSGAHDRDTLLRAPHTHLLESVADLLAQAPMDKPGSRGFRLSGS